jgi:uncharacterized membrane protein
MNRFLTLVTGSFLFLLVWVCGMSWGGFLIEWVRTPHSGPPIYYLGEAWLNFLTTLLPGGDWVRTRWVETPVLHSLTSHLPGLILGGMGGILLWWGVTLASAWQNVLFFRKALILTGLCFLPLLAYPFLIAWEMGAERSVGHWAALLPTVLALLALGEVARGIRKASLPSARSAPPLSGTWDFVPFALLALFALQRGLAWYEVAALRHNHFYSHGYDMALMAHVMNNLVTGNGLTSSLILSGGSFLGHHFSPILYLLGPFYYFCPHPECLILVQSLMVSFAAIPLFHFAKKYLKSAWAGAAVGMLYLFLPGLSEGAYAEFHTISLTPFFLFWLASEMVEREGKRWLVPFVLLLALQENTFFYALALGLFLAIHRAYRMRGLTLAASSLLAGVLIFLVFQPLFRPETELGYGFVHRYKDLIPEEDPNSVGVLGLLGRVVTQPATVFSLVFESQRMAVYRTFWQGVGYLPLWNPLSWILLAPNLESTLSSERHLQLWGGHYGFSPVALASLAIVGSLGLFRLWKPLSDRLVPIAWAFTFSAVLWALVSTVLPFSIYYITAFFAQPVEPPEVEMILLTEIPYGSSVGAQSHLLPHLTHQPRIDRVPPGQPRATTLRSNDLPDAELFPTTEPAAGWPDYLAYDPTITDGMCWHNDWYFDRDRALRWLEWLQESGRYRQVYPPDFAPVPEGIQLRILKRAEGASDG